MPSLAELQLIDALHGGFPLEDRPYARVGEQMGMPEDEVIGMLGQLLARGDLSRLGPLFQIERAGGRFVLAAIEVPEDRFESVTDLVNGLPEVAHNYRRDHRLNMWFVLATESADLADQVLERIRSMTGLDVLAFPKEREYFVELRLPLLAEVRQERIDREEPCRPVHGGRVELTALDRHIMLASQGGLSLVREPYADMARQLGVTTAQVLDRLRAMLDNGVIRRIGAVPHHYRLGFVANGMSVWDVDDSQVDALGESIGRLASVSHCYRRPRHAPAWPYNLFAMLHGRSRAEVESQALRLRDVLGTACRDHDILYSSAVLKKTGLRLRASAASPVASKG